MRERRQQFKSWRAAMRQLVADIGGAEVMSKALWPKRETKKGADLINRWIQERGKRRELPDFEEIFDMLRVGRSRGKHVGMNVLSALLNYSRPQPVDPANQLDEIAQLIREQQRALDDSIDTYKRLKADLDVLSAERTPRFEP